MAMLMPMLMPPPTPAGYNNTNQTSSNMDGMASMHMTFFWGRDVEILFAGWPGAGRLGMYILALAVVFLFAVTAEILSAFPKLKRRGMNPAAGALTLAGGYGIRMGLAYLIMLSVMSFNIGVFVAAVVGHAVGCFLVKYRALMAGEYIP